MIKVTDKGNKTIAECENCGCRFSYGKEDIKKDTLYDPDSRLDETIYYVECPGCGKPHTFLIEEGGDQN